MIGDARVVGFTGCGAAWLARLTGGQEVGSSNLPSPTINVQVRWHKLFLFHLRSLQRLPVRLPIVTRGILECSAASPVSGLGFTSPHVTSWNGRLSFVSGFRVVTVVECTVSRFSGELNDPRVADHVNG